MACGCTGSWRGTAWHCRAFAAAVLVLGVNLGTALLVLAPRLLALPTLGMSIGVAVTSGLHAALLFARGRSEGLCWSPGDWPGQRAASGRSRFACRRWCAGC